MASRRRSRKPLRFRVGKVSVYPHHAAWWVYFRDRGCPVRRRAGDDRAAAERLAAEINARLAAGTPAVPVFTPVSVPDLRRAFLDRHEHVLGSAVATVRRYEAATAHLERFALSHPKPPLAHEVDADAFAAWLRRVEVAPNGHPNSPKRKLQGAGVRFVLETCRALFNYAARRRHLPPYAENPFGRLPPERHKARDAKPVYVFGAAAEAAFLAALPASAFAIHFTLAKTGLRVGEATHLLTEDLDLESGWLRVRNKPGLGWTVKTGSERDVPLLPEVVDVLKAELGPRANGPVFLRPRFRGGEAPPFGGGLAELEAACRGREAAAGRPPSRREALRVARSVWRDAGALKPDEVRTSFVRAARRLGLPDHATCPKSWRHTFATLLQEAEVDPLVRQLVLGHRTDGPGGLGMTGVYTHTALATLRRQVFAALRLRPDTLVPARRVAAGPSPGGEA